MAATNGFMLPTYTKEIAKINESLLHCCGMDKKTQTWLEIAENDLEFAEQILKNRQRPYYAVHFCHQAVEKIDLAPHYLGTKYPEDLAKFYRQYSIAFVENLFA